MKGALLRLSFLLLAFSVAWGQPYKADKAGPLAAEVASGIAQVLAKTGFQISNNGTKYCELWFRTELPVVPRNAAENPPNVTLPHVPVGALLGVIRFEAPGSDRGGQSVQPGVYLLRYGILPDNENHQGAAPHRDFLLLTPAANDRDAGATPDFDALLAMSRKASRSAHPAVLSFWKTDTDAPGFWQQGDTDWVLETAIGDTPIAVIVAGVAGG
ncbi:MAG: hypothetical protein ABSH31_18125 [Bryobacteraceae bacterium]|jgi:hypothetical protein